MNKSNISARQKAVISALGSVRAEGLSPSQKTKKRLNDYANGKITIQELRRITVREVKLGLISR
jgi:hypothetical protein